MAVKAGPVALIVLPLTLRVEYVDSTVVFVVLKGMYLLMALLVYVVMLATVRLTVNVIQDIVNLDITVKASQDV